MAHGHSLGVELALPHGALPGEVAVYAMRCAAFVAAASCSGVSRRSSASLAARCSAVSAANCTAPGAGPAGSFDAPHPIEKMK